MTERAESFKRELAELCKKYRCEITAADHWMGYAECGEDVRITVEFEGDWEAKLEWEDLDLGRWFRPSDVK